MKIRNDDGHLLLMCALRYALGRHSYITGFVAGLIDDNFDNFTDHQLCMFRKEIDVHLFEEKDLTSFSQIDYDLWTELTLRISDELKSRTYFGDGIEQRGNWGEDE